MVDKQDPKGRRGDPTDNGLISKNTARVVVGVATGAFVANLAASILNEPLNLNYSPSEAINGIFTVVVATAVALRQKGRE